MNYRQAVAHVLEQLDDPSHDLPAARAGVRLALIAWRHLGATHPAWDRFALQILALDEHLPGLADVKVDCQPPHLHDPMIAPAVAMLVDAIADLLDKRADAAATAAVRVAHTAAAIRLRNAAHLLAMTGPRADSDAAPPREG